MTAVRYGLAAASTILGVLLGSLCAAGCGMGDCDCGPYEPIVEGTFDVIRVQSPNVAVPVEVSGGTVTVGSSGVTVEYSRGQARVSASYAVRK